MIKHGSFVCLEELTQHFPDFGPLCFPEEIHWKGDPFLLVPAESDRPDPCGEVLEAERLNVTGQGWVFEQL